MAIRVLRLGTARVRGEGPRLGTVRRPPRGVPKSRFASENWFDCWFPVLAPSESTLKLGRGAVIPLDHRVGEPVEVVVNGRIVARGAVVVVEDENSRFGVSLTEIVGGNTGDPEG